MIALLVLAIGVLGYAGMQLTALKAAEDANNRAQATLLGQDALERFWPMKPQWRRTPMLMNGQMRARLLRQKPAKLNDCITKSCNADDLASWDISMLAWQAANRLPAGMIAVDECKHATGISCVVISWNDDAPDDCMTKDGVNTDEGTSCVVLEVAR